MIQPPVRAPAHRCASRSFVGVVQANNPRLWHGPVPAFGPGSGKAWWNFLFSCKKVNENDFAREAPTNWIKLVLIPACYFIWWDYPIRALHSITMYKKPWGQREDMEEWCAPRLPPRTRSRVFDNSVRPHGLRRLFLQNGFNRSTFVVAMLVNFGCFLPILLSAIFLPFWRAEKAITAGISAAVRERHTRLAKLIRHYYLYFFIYWGINLWMCAPPPPTPPFARFSLSYSESTH